MVSVSVTLSEWLYRAVLSKSVLTLSRDYFGLRKPLERRLYELARKHCGSQPDWRVSVEVLLKKSGSASPRRVFRAMLREIIRADTCPTTSFDGGAGRHDPRHPARPRCSRPGRAARSLCARDAGRGARPAPGWDVYALEAEWRAVWAATGRPRLRSPDKAFLGWVRKKVRNTV